LEDQVYSDPERRRLIQQCLQKYENGGVIAYAAEGRVLDRYGNAVTPGAVEDESMRRLTRSVDSLEEDYGGMDPRDAGFAAAGDREVFDEGFHASDYIRIGTIGADIASMVTAFLGPEGMVASGILGLASTAGTLVADLADDSVSTGETIKGLGIGLGLSVLGMIPGWGAEATGIRTLKTVAKYVPKVINLATAGMITLNPDTIESLKKAVDGNKHNKLTVKDWRNIGYAFQAVAGLTRGGRGAYLMKQGKNQARVATGKGPKMSVLDKEGKKIEIPKEQQEAFREAAKNDDVEGMNSILKEITGKEEAGVKTETSKKYKLFGEEQTHLADNAISETAQEYAYDWSKLNPKQFGSLGNKYSNANWVRQAVAADQARGFNPFTWRRKAAAAAKANDAAVTRSAREADIRTRWAERAKLRKPIKTGISEESISAQEAAMQRAEAAHNSAQEAAGRRQRVAHEDIDIEQAAARDARKKTESDFEANELDLRAKEATKEATAWKKKYLQTEEKIDKAQSKLDKTSDPEKAKKIRKELSDLKKEIKSLRKEGREKYNVSTKPGQKYRDTASAKDFEAEFRASADNTRTAGYEQRRSQMRQELTRQAESDKAKVAGRRSSIDQTAKDERLQALREFRSKTSEAASTGTTSADTQVRAAAKS